MKYFLILVLCAGCDSSRQRGHDNPDLSTDAGGRDGGIPEFDPDPTTCAEAVMIRSNVGCEYWPTVTPNTVRPVFDFTVVVANTGGATANVTLTGGALSTPSMTAIPPGQLAKIYLPWVPELKQDHGDPDCSQPMDPAESVRADGKAYHLVSTTPVVVYQFNALEYAGKGGPPGKDWLPCEMAAPACGFPSCLSFTNDASLLLPSSALTGSYRVIGWHASYGWGGVMAITATQDDTNVTVKLPSTSSTLAGTGVLAIPNGGKSTFNMNQGDVVLLATAPPDPWDRDLGGSLVKADKPIQVISADQCTVNPDQALACDHIEESVIPAETLGRHYLVAGVSGPQGHKVGQTVRLVGNVDGTNLTYNPTVAGAPATLNAGQVADIGPTDADFEVTGDHEFTVATIQQGSSVVDPGMPELMQRGDPSLSQTFAVEQYRRSYLFLAPDDYERSFVDVIAPTEAQLELDGQAVSVARTPIGTSDFSVARIELESAMSGVHRLRSDRPMGIQVVGYGVATSYQYPGGGNLQTIAPSPPIM